MREENEKRERKGERERERGLVGEMHRLQ